MSDDDVPQIHVPDEIKVLDVAIEPSKHLARLGKGIWAIAAGACVSTAMFACASLIGVTRCLANGTVKVFDALAVKTGRKRVILDRESDKPYLVRYYLLWRSRPLWFPFNIFLHQFLRSDPDDLHDHPWGFFTVILRGGYWEHVYADDDKQDTVRMWRAPGFFQSVDPMHTHRIELDESAGPCWTLFIPYRRSREWGFYRSLGNGQEPRWMDNEHYFRHKWVIRERRATALHDAAREEAEEAAREEADELKNRLEAQDPLAVHLTPD